MADVAPVNAAVIMHKAMHVDKYGCPAFTGFLAHDQAPPRRTTYAPAPASLGTTRRRSAYADQHHTLFVSILSSKPPQSMLAARRRMPTMNLRMDLPPACVRSCLLYECSAFTRGSCARSRGRRGGRSPLLAVSQRSSLTAGVSDNNGAILVVRCSDLRLSGAGRREVLLGKPHWTLSAKAAGRY